MKNIIDNLREFKLTSLAVDNATSVFMIAFMILLFGIRSYNDMPKEQFPEASLPTVYINTPYFGNSAEEIENYVSRPLEKEIENQTGIKYVKSTSVQDFSVIIAEFDADIDMTLAVNRVKDAVDLAKSELPEDLSSEPAVLEVNMSDIPIVTINISGDYSNDELKLFGEYIKDRVELIKEVSEVDMKGDREREVRIDVDMVKMQAVKVSFSDIENAFRTENLTMSGGEMLNNQFKRSVRIIGQFGDVEEMEKMIVKSENQRPIYLRDIADVSFNYEERSSIARSDQYPVISLDIIKRRGENLINAADGIKKVIEEAKPNLPPDLKISLFNDQSVYTKNEVDNLLNSIISGVILVVLVLLFFLGLRNAMFVGIAIPLSMLTGILILHVTGTTMNIVVLFALILALGLLVDNAIVVVENIYRYMQNGYNNIEAAKYGTGEVALPIIASTATTLAAFLPLAFWPGLMGEFLFYLPATLIIVLCSSLFVALVINPVLTSALMKVDQRTDDKAARNKKRRNILIGSVIMLMGAILFHFADVLWVRNLLGIALIVSLVNFFLLRPASFYFQERILPVLEKLYDKFIRFVLGGFKPILTLFGTFLLLIGSLILLGLNMPKVEFFPIADPLYVNVFIELPMGKDIEATNEFVKDIEDRVIETLEPNMDIVEAVLTQIGENTSDPNSPPEPGVTPNKARITISFVETKERGEKSSRTIMEEVRAAVSGYAGVQIFVDQNASGPPVGKPITIELRGDDVDSLVVVSDRMIKYINDQSIPGIEELKPDVRLGKPELIVNVDRESARRYEISTYSIADAIRTSIFGKEVSKFKQGEEEYPIMVRLSEQYKNNISSILDQKVTFRNPANGQLTQVPISAVSDVQYSSTYSSIKRKDGKRLITIASNVLEGYNPNEIVAEIKASLESFDFADGMSFEFAGEQQQQAEDMAFLMNAFFIAIFAIFIILVAQFNSLLSPFIIVLSILFSTIGVFLGYAFTGRTITVIFTGVGIISLAGIVVNNAIVLIDYINLLIRRKLKKLGLDSAEDLSFSDIKECIIEGGATRLRPVLLTAITTILGLVPLAVGFNFNFFTLITELDPKIFIGGDNTAMWGPMSWTVIYGLSFATFLTLVVIPVMYWLAFRMKFGVTKIFKKK